MSDIWNHVTVYGPPSEIDMFKQLCIAPSESVFSVRQFGWDGCDCTISCPPRAKTDDELNLGKWHSIDVDNFQQFLPKNRAEYSFSFDTYHPFPDKIFALLAERFPMLAFDCNCIQELDESMGYGWFNAPPEGEPFRQDYQVPKNYWKSGRGCKRGRAAQIAHAARIAKLLGEALQYDGEVSDG